jgi:acyl carrier protein
MYRTGDRVRRLVDGALLFTGRVDLQVKVRGVRVEVEEVEAALVGVPGVTRAYVTLSGHDNLVALVTGDADVAKIRARLLETLPRAFVPDRIEVCDELPSLPTGKVDRAGAAALIATPVAGGDGGASGVLADTWCEVLGVDSVSPADDFFASGGHSLLAVELIVVVNERLGCGVALEDFFQLPTYGALAVLAGQPT